MLDNVKMRDLKINREHEQMFDKKNKKLYQKSYSFHILYDIIVGVKRRED